MKEKIIQSLPEDTQVPTESIKEFYTLYVPFSAAINVMATKLFDMRDIFNNELKVREIEMNEENSKKISL